LVIAFGVFDATSTPAATLTACLRPSRATRAAPLVSFSHQWAARPDAPVRRCTPGASWRGGTVLHYAFRGSGCRAGATSSLSAYVFFFWLREASREGSLYCRWLAPCSDRGGRLLGLPSHPRRREGPPRRNHVQTLGVGGWRGSARARLRGGGCHDTPRSVNSPHTACAVEPGRACRRRRRQCTVVYTVGDRCWHCERGTLPLRTGARCGLLLLFDWLHWASPLRFGRWW